MDEIYVKLAQNLAKSSKVLDLRSMSKFEQKVVFDYLGNKATTASIGALNLSFWFKFAQAVTLYRPVVGLGGDDIFLNFYALLIAPSGNYKDQGLKFLNKTMMVPYYQRFEDKHSTYMALEESNVKKEAEIKFEKGGVNKDNYIEAHRPRTILTEGSNGTVQGWHSQREAIAKADFGAANYINSEFGDILERYNESDAMILTYLKESFDGETQAIVIKGDKNLSAIRGVPSNMFAHSPLASIFSIKAKRNLERYLNSGLSRRTFICFEPTKAERKLVEQQGLDVDTYYSSLAKREIEVNEFGRTLIEEMGEILDFVQSNRRLYLSDKAYIKLRLYRDSLSMQSRGMDLLTDEGISAEIDSRWFKVLKLSGLIALSEKVSTITDTHIAMAMTQTEYYARYVKQLYTTTSPDAAYRVFKFLKANLGASFSSNEVVEQAKIGRKYMSDNRKQIEQSVREMAEDVGYKLLVISHKNRFTYSLREASIAEDMENLDIEYLIRNIGLDSDVV